MTVYYRAGRRLIRGLSPLLLTLEVEGTQNIPKEGGFLILSNHLSALDPLCLQSSLDREIHAMTKSTQFSHPVFRWLLPRLHAFPTRRYTVDPQCVRTALRLLHSGAGVCIYAEGERSWTGELQPFRSGTVRLALKADVPVIPCGMAGTYQAQPRWSRRIRRTRVQVRFGPPIHFGPHDSRRERDAAYPAARARLEGEIRRLAQLPS